MSIKERVQSPTPNFFKKIRNIGLVLAAVGGAIITAPIALPAAVVQIGGYLAVAGGIASAVSQATTSGDDQQKKEEE